MRLIRVALVTACTAVPSSQSGGQAATTQEVRHPDAKYVDQSIPARVIRFSDAATASPMRMLRPTTVQMGAEEGSDDVVMSRMNAVSINRSGQVLVLDELSSAVRVFEANGKFVQRIGRPGKGPGDFDNARVMALGPAEELVVYDLQGRFQVFVQRSGRYDLDRTIPVDVAVDAMCFLGNRLFVNGIIAGEKPVLRELDYRTGKVVRGFGHIYDSPSFGTNVQVNAGKLLCDNTNQLIVLATSSLVGEVRAWRPDGSPAWRVSIPDYKSNIVKSVGGKRSVELSPDGITSLHALALVPGVGIVANYGARTRQQILEKEAYGTPSTLVINPASGAATWMRTPWPIIGAVMGSQVATVTEDPYPMVRMFSLSTGR